ncbi:uncharacterized protein OCT59_000397 [Rhizophagus irregularis]|uniref:uncharacterized protein n=1 Tax=Rhizophagus irregularis TaxID=588596 RepID=UPI00332FE092|nr:hypothetical protein OCT59_000397 [Rhizophagus irregularis]
MESLGINSLNISSNQEAILDSKEFRIFKILFNKEENTILQAANVAPGSSSNELNFPEIISETNLLKLDSDFDIIKENTIKTLVNHLIKVYDKILEEHIETEIRRRRKFRGYVNFLMIYQKIEVYCNLYKTRARGETIKNQTNKKIIEYSSSSKFKTQDISIFIKTGKRIEKLISLSNRKWGIIDAFPNLDINFFKSTTSNAAYEVWLKLIETGLIMTKEEGQTIYNYKKIEENYLREYKLQRIYKSIQASDHDDTGFPRYYFNEDDDGDNDEMMID